MDKTGWCQGTTSQKKGDNILFLRGTLLEPVPGGSHGWLTQRRLFPSPYRSTQIGFLFTQKRLSRIAVFASRALPEYTSKS
ncbi:hypothetical protein COV05_02015 [Candidatus Uhrbacteria bacterium CG10_big_fil_rev_8_21_14_0_10_48_16]|uniref:Uncharacterized protein n=1 Tax=Candidatus Uhrbacteria bacterium CG10_big_fil_rev_8_21_14_0_10_48_16 TaxID=1975038 RepID=A0A2M8LHM7_9BACT|nr:MAG: hypothetical protein COV05_02015 [Candidatus Uhrbacteria bacterium CG10_big_fil_rev_8_21_14_0_10_48_16]